MVESTSRVWVHRRGVLSLARPQVMGVLNVTPDSFSDGGALLGEGARVDPARVRERGQRMLDAGAVILDVGGESTRPGSDPVTPEDERGRVLPAIEALAPLGATLSIDTRHASVARAALEAGADIVNDISGLADPDMVEVVARAEAGVVLGHLRGTPKTMQAQVRFADLLGEVTQELCERVDRLVAAGVPKAKILVDPGIGFGKSAEQSAALVAASGWLREATGCDVLIGASRKSFLGALSRSRQEPSRRLAGSLSAALVAVEHGASVLRVHDVQETVEALAVAAAIRRAYDEHERRAKAGVLQ